MKTLYIHIGTPKTASTSIQKFCDDNREILEKSGIHYPDLPYKFHHVGRVRNGHFLVSLIFDEKGNRNTMEEERIFREGLDRIHFLFQKYDNILLSDEGIWNGAYKRRKDLWEILADEAKDHGYQIKVIVYLRRQDKFAGSWWNQQIKAGLRVWSAMTWEDFISIDPPVLQFDYYAGLEQIAQSIDKENIIVRRFGNHYFKNHSVYVDFLDALGLSLTPDYKIPQSKTNTGLYGNYHEIKRVLNEIPSLNASNNLFFRELLLKYSDQKASDKKYSMFSPEEAGLFLKKYDEGNQKIMEEYLGGSDESLFPMDLDKLHKWDRSEVSLENELIHLIGGVAIELRKENLELKEKISTMDKEIAAQKKAFEQFKSKIKHPVKTAFHALKKS